MAAVPRVLLTGMSGTGKSTVRAELVRRGHRTVETDDPGWHRPEGGWDHPRMTALLAAHDDLLVVGTADDQGLFYDRFAHVVLLSAPAEVLLHEAEAITKDAGVATNTVEEDGTR